MAITRRRPPVKRTSNVRRRRDNEIRELIVAGAQERVSPTTRQLLYVDRVNLVMSVWCEGTGLSAETSIQKWARWVAKLGRCLRKQKLVDRGPVEGTENTLGRRLAVTLLALKGTDSVQKIIAAQQRCRRSNWRAEERPEFMLAPGSLFQREYLGIAPPVATPPGWEGTRPDAPIESPEELAGWLDRQLETHCLVKQIMHQANDDRDDGTDLRNAYRLADQLHLTGLPSEPRRPYTVATVELGLRAILRVLRLPKSSTDPKSSRQPPPDFGISATGRFFWNSKEIDLSVGQFRIVEALWVDDVPTNGVGPWIEIEELIRIDVDQQHVTRRRESGAERAVDQTLRRIRYSFAAQHIPLTIKADGARHRRLEKTA